MKKNKSTVLLIAMVLCIYACCRQVPCQDFTKDEQAWIPYKDDDTLVFKNFDNDSIISYSVNYNQGYYQTRRSRESYCNDGCFEGATARLLMINNFCFDVEVTKRKSNDSIVVRDCSFFGQTMKYICFDLNSSSLHDSIKIAGTWMHDVYEYARTDTPPTFKNVYMKNGMGIVKFTLNDNQSFELLKVRKK